MASTAAIVGKVSCVIDDALYAEPIEKITAKRDYALHRKETQRRSVNEQYLEAIGNEMMSNQT